MSTNNVLFPGSLKSDVNVVNDIYHCPYCKYETKALGSYSYHLSFYHEKDAVDDYVTLKESRKVKSAQEMFSFAYFNAFLLARGYVMCPVYKVPCPTKINPLTASMCKDIHDCPDELEQVSEADERLLREKTRRQ